MNNRNGTLKFRQWSNKPSSFCAPGPTNIIQRCDWNVRSTEGVSLVNSGRFLTAVRCAVCGAREIEIADDPLSNPSPSFISTRSCQCSSKLFWSKTTRKMADASSAKSDRILDFKEPTIVSTD